MKTVAVTLAVQFAFLIGCTSTYFLVNTDRAVYEARMMATAVQTIFAPRGKTAESDKMVQATGRARLAAKVFGNWSRMSDLEIVFEEVLGAETYRAVYVDPETGELKSFEEEVEWLVMAEKTPFVKQFDTVDDLKADVAAGRSVMVDRTGEYDDAAEVH